MVAGSPVELKPYMESGKLRALAVLDTKPSPFLPGVPLVTDTLKDCPPAVTYNGLLGPKDIPQEAVDVLSNALIAGRQSQEFMQRFSNVGLQPLLTSSDEFAKIFVQDAAVWNGIMPSLGLKK
jgi:tripartite-type tricarboxylate transporter receptor subunit TctC